MHTPENVKRCRLYETSLVARRRLTWADTTLPRPVIARTGGLPKAATLDQVQLLEENVHLKQSFASVQQENLRLKKQVEALKHQLKPAAPPEGVGSQSMPREFK